MAKAKFQAWGEQHSALNSAADCMRAYEAGFAGCVDDPAAKAELNALSKQQSGYECVDDAAHGNHWAESGAGKLVVPFVFVEKEFPGCWPGQQQTVGSCVSHGARNAILTTLGCEVHANLPDPRTGKLEGKPQIHERGIRNGTLASAPIYWQRGYNGHGWHCASAVKVVTTVVGCVPMQNYESLGVDLTNCDYRTECLYGSRRMPEPWFDVFGRHKLHAGAEVRSFEALRDALYNGYGVIDCGSEGYSSTRNEDGVSRRQGSWAHSMSVIGVDDRDIIKQKYSQPLVLIMNSWGNWNRGPRKILGTELEIPNGSFWTPWGDCKNRYKAALSNVDGWPPQKLPDFGFETWMN